MHALNEVGVFQPTASLCVLRPFAHLPIYGLPRVKVVTIRAATVELQNRSSVNLGVTSLRDPTQTRTWGDVITANFTFITLS